MSHVIYHECEQIGLMDGNGKWDELVAGTDSSASCEPYYK